MPVFSAALNSAPFQPPMPVSWSGVMFGGQHIPERRLDRPASREWLATARNGVTGCAVRRDCQVLALLNEAEVLFVDRVASGAVSEAGEADASGSGQQFCAVTHGQAAPDF